MAQWGIAANTGTRTYHAVRVRQALHRAQTLSGLSRKQFEVRMKELDPAIEGTYPEWVSGRVGISAEALLCAADLSGVQIGALFEGYGKLEELLYRTAELEARLEGIELL